MALKTIKLERKRLADIVYGQLLEAIRSGEISGDERLVQEKLAEQLQISRTPVREALLRLEQDGILVSSPRGGFTLYRMSQDEVRELYQARAAIEGQAVRILASRNDGAVNKTLRDIIRREENISSSSVSDYFNANRTIHRSLVEMARNRYLLEMFDNIWNRATSYNLFATIEKLDLAKSLGDHLRLVEAIETGNPTVAMEAIVDHIQHGFDLQIEALEKQQKHSAVQIIQPVMDSGFVWGIRHFAGYLASFGEFRVVRGFWLCFGIFGFWHVFSRRRMKSAPPGRNFRTPPAIVSEGFQVQ